MRAQLLETAPVDIREEIERDVHLGGSKSNAKPPEGAAESKPAKKKKKPRKKDEL